MRFLELLPLVVVMVSGPQVVSVVFLATSERYRANSAAFVFGAALSITLVVAVAYAFGVGVTGAGASHRWISALVFAALVVAMVHTYRTRGESDPPRWLAELETASPRFSFLLGFSLMGFFPTDLFTSTAVGSYLAATETPLSHAVPFVLLTLGVLSLPALTVVAFGERAERALPTVRTWMNEHDWIVSELVLALFGLLALRNLFG